MILISRIKNKFRWLKLEHEEPRFEIDISIGRSPFPFFYQRVRYVKYPPSNTNFCIDNGVMVTKFTSNYFCFSKGDTGFRFPYKYMNKLQFSTEDKISLVEYKRQISKINYKTKDEWQRLDKINQLL